MMFLIGVDATCYVCNKSVVGSPTYTCTSHDDIACQNFYLHKTCAELPTQIHHDEHDQHSLTLQPRPMCVYDICDHETKFAYACVDCNFDVCVVCAFACPSDEQRVLRHEVNTEHTLTLQREALFVCDACWEESKDFSYVCITCDFWIHKRCAFSPSVIPDPAYHHHPLNLAFSNFLVNKCLHCYHVLTKFYLFSEMRLKPLALFDLITIQCAKFQVDFKGKREDTITISKTPSDPRIIIEHWSHPNHPLEQRHFSENHNHDDDDRRVLICDGCIQPITVTHPSYYACIQCGFFLHSLCACKLPQELPIGA